MNADNWEYATGQIFFLDALDHLAIDKDTKVTWISLDDLGLLVRSHGPDDTVTKMVSQLLRADLIIIDDIGLPSVTVDSAEGRWCCNDS